MANLVQARSARCLPGSFAAGASVAARHRDLIEDALDHN